MNRTIYIYTLSDPRNGHIRYVGKTVNMVNRFIQHCNRQKNSHLKNWIMQLKNAGLSPIMEEIEKCDSSDESQWQEAEQFWIVYLRFLGFKLINVKPGGIGCGVMSEASKQKLSKAKMGIRPSAEVRAEMSRTRKGKCHPKVLAHLRSLSKARIGKSVSEKTKQVAGARFRGKHLPIEHREKLKFAWIARKARGNPFPQETHAKFVEASRKGHETKRLKREAKLGQMFPIFNNEVLHG